VVCFSSPLPPPGESLLGSGVLSCLDGYMNIALEQTEEHVNGTVTNRYGDAFIRGNNGMMASLALVLPPDVSVYSSLHISR
jgi:hypothetical protein